MHSPTRRNLLTGAGALAGVTLLAVRPSQATPDTMKAAIRKIVGEATVNKGKISIDVPPLVENGNVVPLTVSVASPMTAAGHVKGIHIFTERNPQPNVIDVTLGPRAGKAGVTTRIRLSDAQKIVVVAQLS